MGKGSRWLRNTVNGFRKFAHGGETHRPRLGLALGGGFARGIAHIGILRVFRDHNIPIDVLAGTSVGALVGAAYAAGTSPEEMERVAINTRFRDFGRWRVSRMGMASNERLEHYLHRFTTAGRFEDLKIPFAILATDLIGGESVYFTHGEIGPALRASCAYPGLFIPVEYQNHLLVDGFLSGMVPSEAARHLGADVVVGVYLEPGLLHSRPRNTIEIIGRSFSIIQGNSIGKWRRSTDLIIEPKVTHILWDDFARAPEIVAAGEQAARVALPEIRELIKRHVPSR